MSVRGFTVAGILAAGLLLGGCADDGSRAVAPTAPSFDGSTTGTDSTSISTTSGETCLEDNGGGFGSGGIVCNP